MPYKCLTLSVDVQSSNVRVSSVTGYHHYRKNDNHVERIEFMSSWSSHLPSGFGILFQNLAEFEVRDTPLRALKRRNFEDMTKLLLLTVENTKLTSIPEDTFNDLVSLQKLTIRKNLITTLSPKLFHPLKNLRAFDGKFNKISLLEEDLFSRNFKIESINFSGNILREIQVNFTNFKNVFEIYLFKCGCVDVYYVKSNFILTIKELQKLINKKCRESTCNDY